ncbi:MAG: hypothetical protein HYR80_07060 [Nitrospirae bacterium]|nr:hypothetical protein [Nitrospirota bacterium]
MGKLGLSSKIVLILANDLNLSLSLKNELQKDAGIVDIAPNLHQAVIHTILKEPDLIFIEVAPDNYSGLQLLELLKKLKGVKKNPRIFMFADKSLEGRFRQKSREILFFDSRGTSSISQQVRTVLEGSSSFESEIAVPWIHQYQERGDAYPASQKEQEILEKLGQLGILKRK